MQSFLSVGIDIGSTENVAHFMDQHGNKVSKQLTFPNNLPGAKSLEAVIIEAAKNINAKKVKIGMEATSVYNFHLANYLSENENLEKLNTDVFVINPKLIKNFKKAYTEQSKTDPVCAFSIADFVRFGRLPKPYALSIKYQPLQRLTRFRLHLIETLTKEKQFLLNQLFLKLSAYKQVGTFSNDFGATSLAVIEELSAEQLAQISIEDLTDFVISKSRNRFSNPKEVAHNLKRIGRESYRIKPSLNDSITVIMSMSLKNIKALQKNLKEVDKAIESETAAFSESTILQSIPGIGPVLSAGILAEITDVRKFKSEAALAKFAGLVWKKTQSGKFNAQVTRLAKTGNKYLRYYLVEATSHTRIHVREYSDYYQTKYNETNRFQHKRALVLTARKLLRLIFSLLRDNRLYQNYDHQAGQEVEA
jgi:transposase